MSEHRWLEYDHNSLWSLMRFYFSWTPKCHAKRLICFQTIYSNLSSVTGWRTITLARTHAIALIQLKQSACFFHLISLIDTSLLLYFLLFNHLDIPWLSLSNVSDFFHCSLPSTYIYIHSYRDARGLPLFFFSLLFIYWLETLTETK